MLERAVKEGVITEEQRAQMEAIAAADPGDSEERFRPVSNFNEIFVTIGAMLLTSAITGLLSLIMDSAILEAMVGGIVYVFAAEYFHNRKRFRLPIVVMALSAAFAFGTSVFLMILASKGIDAYKATEAEYILPLITGMGVLALAAWRYVLPFLMLPLSIVFTMTVTYAAKVSDNTLSYKLLLGGSGLAILAFAIRCDLLDPERTKRLSDFAFWSYIVGSPLFVLHCS